jgi:hypothetical protein
VIEENKNDLDRVRSNKGVMMDIEEYRALVLNHATSCGYGPPRIEKNSWVFESPEGAIKAVIYQPTYPFYTDDYATILHYAKVSLTKAQNKALKKHSG